MRAALELATDTRALLVHALLAAGVDRHLVRVRVGVRVGARVKVPW